MRQQTIKWYDLVFWCLLLATCFFGVLLVHSSNIVQLKQDIENNDIVKYNRTHIERNTESMERIESQLSIIDARLESIDMTLRTLSN